MSNSYEKGLWDNVLGNLKKLTAAVITDCWTLKIRSSDLVTVKIVRHSWKQCKKSFCNSGNSSLFRASFLMLNLAEPSLCW